MKTLHILIIGLLIPAFGSAQKYSSDSTLLRFNIRMLIMTDNFEDFSWTQDQVKVFVNDTFSFHLTKIKSDGFDTKYTFFRMDLKYNMEEYNNLVDSNKIKNGYPDNHPTSNFFIIGVNEMTHRTYRLIGFGCDDISDFYKDLRIMFHNRYYQLKKKKFMKSFKIEGMIIQDFLKQTK